MKNIIVSKNEDGKRLSKVLEKYLDTASLSFIYKMLRKKNITLNGKKAEGTEKLQLGDEIKIWLSDETLEKFTSVHTENNNYQNIEKKLDKTRIIYEDEDVVFYNKEEGLLSQKADSKDVSLNELFIKYLIDEEKINKKDLETFKPSIINRLDRNTTGIIMLGKSLKALRDLSQYIKERKIKKTYLCIVEGEVLVGNKLNTRQRKQVFLYKDKKNNKVIIKDKEFLNSVLIDTEYEVLYSDGEKTLLKVILHTGKTHQIRAFFSYLGHPLLGDIKYGAKKFKNINTQVLHSYELNFPKLDEFKNLSNKSFKAKLPKKFKLILGEIDGYLEI